MECSERQYQFWLGSQYPDKMYPAGGGLYTSLYLILNRPFYSIYYEKNLTIVSDVLC